MSGVLPSIIYPSTVADEQKRLAAALDGTNTSVAACASLDTPSRTAWGLFYGAALGFTKEDPGYFGLGTMMDRAQSYEAELLAWQQKLSSSCSLGIPLFDPNPPTSPQIFSYIMWTAIALGGAYVVGQVVAFVPKPAPRAPRALAKRR